MGFEIVGSDGKTEISNIHDWELHGKPARDYHWKKGRSAFEIASSWLPNKRPGIPDEFHSLFNGHFSDELILTKAIVEKKTRFLDTHFGPRNHDLLIHAKLGDKKAILSIEAKERESFDKSLEGKISAIKSPKSRLPNRINRFSQGILGLDYDKKTEIGKLYYQLFSGVAGLAHEVQLEGADFGVFVVQQIISADTPGSAVAFNNICFDEFRKMLPVSKQSHSKVSADSGLWGPYELPGSDLVPKTKIYLAKFKTAV